MSENDLDDTAWEDLSTAQKIALKLTDTGMKYSEALEWVEEAQAEARGDIGYRTPRGITGGFST